MADFLLRPPAETDLPEITDCWQRSFGDPPELIRALLDTGELLSCAMAAEQDGHLRSVMFALDGLLFDGIPAAYLYALCTHPDVRGQGMGRAVLGALTAACLGRGAELVFLSPADPGLAEWYRSMGMRSAPRQCGSARHAEPDGTSSLSAISAEDYAALRRSPIVLPLRLLRAQELLSRQSGGGFFRIQAGGETAVLCAEPEADQLRIRELCCLPQHRTAVLSAAAAAFQCRAFSPDPCDFVYIMKDPDALPPAALSEFSFVLD